MDIRKILMCLLFPDRVIVWLLSPAALVLLIYSALYLEPTDIVSIISYALSFYALVIISLRIPDIIRFVKRFRRENRILARYSSDVRFRMKISLCSAVIFNGIYAALQLGMGLRHHSVWFYSMAGYYLLLALLRLMLAKHTRANAPGELPEEEWRKYRLCGVCIMLITLALTVFVLYFVWKIRVFRHHEITTISMAAYTFTSLTFAIVNAVRYKSYGSPVYSAAKAISLVSAAVSVLTLENAMLTAFGQDSGESFHRYMLGATGAGVIIFVQTISVYMTVKACRQLKKITRPAHKVGAGERK